jgi:uncharacterized membrane protein
MNGKGYATRAPDVSPSNRGLPRKSPAPLDWSSYAATEEDMRRESRPNAGIPLARAGVVAWNKLFRALSYVRSALWIVPLLAIVLVLALAPLVRWLDAWLQWPFAGLGIEGARALCETVITLSLSFMVFTFGSLLVAIQVASGQLTPRIIATTLLRNNVVRYSVGLFVFALVFSVMTLDRLDTGQLGLASFIVALLGIACMATFLFLIDYAARLLRPVSILSQVGADGLRVIVSVYPEHLHAGPDAPRFSPPPGASRIVRHAGPPGIVLAVDREALVADAALANGIIELVPHVGDFVAVDEPLLTLYGGAVAVADARVREAVAIGTERTMEQDPLFAFRILTDIALKALSPAINDPTTAVLALDQIQHLLRAVGRRRLRGELVDDSLGVHRLVYRTPNWEDFVHIGCTEIRGAGAGSLQVARRLRSMLENLIATLPPQRHAALIDERDRLDFALEALYPHPADLALARVPDSQGLGASASAPAPRTASQVRSAHT